MLFCIAFITQGVYAERLRRINCPYCGESLVTILDEEYGVCQCESCDGMMLIVNGRVELEDGTSMPLRDLYDMDALIEAIENGEFDVDDATEYNNYREYLDEDDEGEESYYEDSSSSTSDNYDANDTYDSSNASFKSSLEDSKQYLYSTDFKNSEPESDEEVAAFLEKRNKKKKKATTSAISKISTRSDIVATESRLTIKKKIIPHVIKYYASVESDQYITEVVLNGEEFKLREAVSIDGFKFLGWSPDKEGKLLFDSGAPLILYNFNKFNMPSAQIYSFYAIWEKIDEENK